MESRVLWSQASDVDAQELLSRKKRLLEKTEELRAELTAAELSQSKHEEESYESHLSADFTLPALQEFRCSRLAAREELIEWKSAFSEALRQLKNQENELRPEQRRRDQLLEEVNSLEKSQEEEKAELRRLKEEERALEISSREEASSLERLTREEASEMKMLQQGRFFCKDLDAAITDELSKAAAAYQAKIPTVVVHQPTSTSTSSRPAVRRMQAVTFGDEGEIHFLRPADGRLEDGGEDGQGTGLMKRANSHGPGLDDNISEGSQITGQAPSVTSEPASLFRGRKMSSPGNSSRKSLMRSFGELMHLSMSDSQAATSSGSPTDSKAQRLKNRVGKLWSHGGGSPSESSVAEGMATNSQAMISEASIDSPAVSVAPSQFAKH